MTTHDVIVNEETESSQPSQTLLLLLALAGGAGLVLMMLALGIGVAQGDTADGSVISLTFVGGLLLLILGVVGWFVLVQPSKHFDDINQPHFTGHHDHEDHENLELDESSEAQNSILPHEDTQA